MIPIRQIRLSLAGLLCALALLGAGGCDRGTESDPEDEKEEPRAVRVETVRSGAVTRWLSYVADIAGEAEIRVFSAVPDRIVRLNVREGDEVEAGDVIASIRANVLTQGVRQALGGLDAARAQRDSLLDQAERMRRLEGSGAVTSSQLLTVENQLAAAEAQVRQLEAMLGQARQRKGDSLVRAPIDGVVGQVFLEEGDLAAPQLPICTVVAMDRVVVQARVPEPDLPWLREGQPVEVQLAVDDRDPIRATVTRVGPVLDRVSRTASLEVEVDNADRRLKPGMLARLRVQVERREGVPLAPKTALTVTAQRRGGQDLFRAMVQDGEVARERKVLLGLEEGEQVEILDGLEAGERLVVEGQHLLADGDPVRVVTGAADEASDAPAKTAEPETAERASAATATEG